MKIAAAKQKEAIAALHSGASVADCRAFKEAGFRPKAVFRNLQPAHLYEKVRLRCIVFVCACCCCAQKHLRMQQRQAGWLSGLSIVCAVASLTCHKGNSYSHITRFNTTPQALRYEPGTHIVKSGALATSSGVLNSTASIVSCPA